jgi:hypothetical protein
MNVLLSASMGPDGNLRWHVRSTDEVATIDADTGYTHRAISSEGIPSEVFQAVVGALSEWYKVDRRDFDGLNIAKVKRELMER